MMMRPAGISHFLVPISHKGADPLETFENRSDGQSHGPSPCTGRFPHDPPCQRRPYGSFRRRHDESGYDPRAV